MIGFNNQIIKIMKAKFSFLLLIPFFTLISCKKIDIMNSKNEIPTGINHFYFYTVKNGHKTLMVAKKYSTDLGTVPAISVSDNTFEYFQGTFLSAHSGQFMGGKGKDDFDIEFFIADGITHIGNYPILETDANQTGSVYFTQLNQNQSFIKLYHPDQEYYSKPNSGNLTITYLSPDKKELKGYFNMRLYNSQTGDSVQIKDGHFWIHKDSL